MNQPPWRSSKQPLARLKIITLDPNEAGDVRVIAHFNPKEVQIDKGVSWSEHKTNDGEFGLEYAGGSSPRTISLELLFDGAEELRSVRPELDVLHRLTLKVGGTGTAAKRPPVVMVIWGPLEEQDKWSPAEGGIPAFPAVIESLSVKCQMFSADGKVLRATATLKLKEVGTIFSGKKDKKGKSYAA